jgi:thiamine kinase-like enzyme
MEFTYDLCIGLMPELSGLHLDITELKGGITNKLYRVKSSDGRDYVFRLYGQKTELFINRDVEMENMKEMEQTGVTPKLIRYIPEQKTTIVEFIPGYVLKNEDFMKTDLADLIVRPIKIIHGSGTTLPYLFDPLVEVKRFYKILEGINPNYPEFDILGTINLLERLSDVASVPRSQYVPCHNDLLADNFILTDDRERFREPMYLIDWEYGGMSLRHYDIADMFQEILVPREVERRFLRIYWEDRDMDYHEYLTDLFKPFPDIYWFLWSLIQLNISSIPFDYYTYGKVKYENAQKNIGYVRDYYGTKI